MDLGSLNVWGLLEKCWNCNGVGQHIGLWAEMVTCRKCSGEGFVMDYVCQRIMRIGKI